MNNLSAATNLTKHTHRLIAILITVYFSALIFSTTATYFAHQQVISTHQTVADIQNQHLSEEGAYAVKDLLAKDQAAATALLNLFPDSNTLPAFISQLEDLIYSLDPQGEVQLLTNKPAKIGADLTIPMTIRLTTSTYHLLNLFTDLEQLPHVVELVSLEIKPNSLQAGSINAIINIRVYVKNPF